MKKYLITGLVILLPMTLTIVVIIFFFNLFTIPFDNLAFKFLIFLSHCCGTTPSAQFISILSPILAIVFLFFFLCTLGAITRWFLVNMMLKKVNKLISKIPLIKTIYKVSRDVIQAVLSTDGKKAFKHPVMIPFPSHPSSAIGFQAGDVCKEIEEKLKTPMTSVFTPTAPHPISGFLFFIPKNDVKQLAMSNEDAFKFLISCGLIHPNHTIEDR